MLTQQRTRTTSSDKTVYEFSDDKVNWTKGVLAYTEIETLWPYATQDSQVWKYKRDVKDVEALMSQQFR